MKKTVQKGYAKINLHLDMTGIMPNGFHSVNTVMQSLTLCDTVMLSEREDSEITVSSNLPNVPMGTDNIAVRAALAVCDAANRRIGLDIYIEKHIPMAAGLAGGSADAAAALRGTNELLGSPLSTEELCAIGGKLGADVPFCIVGGSRFGDGKGDILHPFPALPECTLLVACGGEGVSTPVAYRMLDEKYNRFENYIPKPLDALKIALDERNLQKIADSMFNIFEEPILSVRPVAVDIKTAMLDSGAIGAMMSGSGPSVFGIFPDMLTAEQAASKIRAFGVSPHICKPINII